MGTLFKSFVKGDQVRLESYDSPRIKDEEDYSVIQNALVERGVTEDLIIPWEEVQFFMNLTTKDKDFFIKYMENLPLWEFMKILNEYYSMADNARDSFKPYRRGNDLGFYWAVLHWFFYSMNPIPYQFKEISIGATRMISWLSESLINRGIIKGSYDLSYAIRLIRDLLEYNRNTSNSLDKMSEEDFEVFLLGWL